MSTIYDKPDNAKTLYDILPEGAEGGKKFAFVIGMLLANETRMTGKNPTFINDAAGDYNGLDGFYRDDIGQDITGYQCKFYPSPLSDKHRTEVEKSLKKVIEREDRMQDGFKLEKWILVTPQDFIHSTRRKGGGDVDWFEGLRKKYNLSFELTHWGHTTLMALFIRFPNLLRYYYPDLANDGNSGAKAIVETRKCYNDNIIKKHSIIQFVGMSVYEKGGTKGISMEHIYIPLYVVPENGDIGAKEGTNPIDLLAPSICSVVLGDPGSGKSTLLRFLALSGISEPIQNNYNIKPDDRLPIFITLKRYGEEIAEHKSLSLLDYIIKNVQCDFNLKSANLDFFAYYLETGRAILLFDGLDELPNSRDKETIRDQVQSLVTTYPGNTVIVTSRKVGYVHPFRLDKKKFHHHYLTGLKIEEMEKFVQDWYKARMGDDKDRKSKAEDLIGVLRDKNHFAIRELAENPLLLTIITLVHWIDVALPDERVVLYQKCTETFLSTWHNAKAHNMLEKYKGKERRNLRRMEAIAYWMHSRSASNREKQRAVVPYADMNSFLNDYIKDKERIADKDQAADEAKAFFEFVKDQAGLFIEIGDEQYSFIHLTFQEYLAAAYIINDIMEEHGLSGIWEVIQNCHKDAAWHEVIRLLVALLKSNDSKRFLVEKLLQNSDKNHGVAAISTILGGLLLDRIGEYVALDEMMIKCLFNTYVPENDTVMLQSVLSTLKMYSEKDVSNKNKINKVFKQMRDSNRTWIFYNFSSKYLKEMETEVAFKH